MNNKKWNKVFIYAFLLLYVMVAAISFFHAIEFFSIGNVRWMSVTLAFAFEVGLAVCLCSILLGNNKNNSIAWILLVLLVLVQVCGNTFSVYKFISTSSEEYYQYLAKPLLFWIQEVTEETVQIIISWIMGAILPIVALLMTEMVSKSIQQSAVEEHETVPTIAPVENDDVPEPVDDEKPVEDNPVEMDPGKMKPIEVTNVDVKPIDDKPITPKPAEKKPVAAPKKPAVVKKETPKKPAKKDSVVKNTIEKIKNAIDVKKVPDKRPEKKSDSSAYIPYRNIGGMTRHNGLDEKTKELRKS